MDVYTHLPYSTPFYLYVNPLPLLYTYVYTYIYTYTYTVGQYYWLIFLILLLLFLPITFLTEPDATHIPQRTFSEHRSELWETLTNRTTLSLLIYVTGSSIITNLSNITTSYIQYYVIGLTNLQAGMGYIYICVIYCIYTVYIYGCTKHMYTVCIRIIYICILCVCIYIQYVYL